MKFEVYQYVSSIIEARALKRLINRANGAAKVILDLEDSIWNIDDVENTRQQKAVARRNLLALFSQNPNLEIGLRINSIASGELACDLRMLEELSNVYWDIIVLPKIESIEEIEIYLWELDNVKCREMIICIESVNGANNLSSILSYIQSDRLSKVQFGHFDYFLDAGTFPIPNQRNEVFWDVCRELISLTESRGYSYIHSPLNELNDPNLIASVIGKLKQTCSTHFGLASISQFQTTHMHMYSSNENQELRMELLKASKEEYARKLMERYRSYHDGKYSFSHDVNEGFFIAPQEYLAARNFLARTERSQNEELLVPDFKTQ